MMEESNDMVRRIWIPGCACTDGCGTDGEDKVSITFDIPGVKKEDVHLKVIKDGLRLEARRDKSTEYVSEYQFLCPADLDHVRANYNSGALTVEVPLVCTDPFKDSKDIPLAS